MAMSEEKELTTAGISRMGNRGRSVARSAPSLTCEGWQRGVATGPSGRIATDAKDRRIDGAGADGQDTALAAPLPLNGGRSEGDIHPPFGEVSVALTRVDANADSVIAAEKGGGWITPLTNERFTFGLVSIPSSA